jgi:hypothetical protein
MKKTCLLLLGSLLFHSASGKSHFSFMPVVSGFYSLNKTDLDKTEGARLFRSNPVPGWSLGISGRLDIKKKAWLSLSPGYRVEPQSLSFYAPGPANRLLKTEHFNNQYLYLKAMFGFKILRRKTNNFDAGFGLRCMYSLNHKEEAFFTHYEPYQDPATGETVRYLSSFYTYKWGDNRVEDNKLLLPCMFDFVVQVAYTNRTILKSGKMLRLALEVGAKMGADATNFDNSGLAKSFNSRNEQVSETTFNDRHLTLGLTLGFEL